MPSFSPENPEIIAQMPDQQAPSPAPASKAYDPSVKLKPEEIKALKRRMQTAQKYYETVFQPWYEQCDKLMRGEHFKVAGDHDVVMNVYPHIIETLTHSVTFNHPEQIVKPQDPLGQENMETAEKVVHYDYRRCKAHREAIRAFKDSRMYNFGVLMAGWEFETDTVCYTDQRLPVEGESPDPEQVLAAVEQGKDLPSPVPKETVRKDGFVVRRIDPRNFRISPESSWVVEDMPWVGFVEYRELPEVKADPRYKNTRQLKGSDKNLQGYLDQEKDGAGNNLDTPADLRRVQLIHYYEKKRRLHIVFCDEHDQALLVEKWPWVHDCYPFGLVFTEPNEGQFYSLPPMLQWKHMQQEINHFHTQLSIHIRRFVRKYVARAGAFTEAQKKKISSGVDGSIAETSDNPMGALIPVQDAQISPDVYNYVAKVWQDLGLLSGIDQYEMNRAPSKRMTQEEVNQIASSGGARAKRAASAFEELCGWIAEQIIAWNQQYAVRARQLPVVQDGKIVDWNGWTKDEIQGEFAFEVYVGSTELKNKAGQVEELGFLLQALQPYVQMPDPATGMPALNMKPLLRQLLALVPEVRDVAAVVGPDQPALGPGQDPAMPGAPGGAMGEVPMDPMTQLAAQGQQSAPPPMGIPGGY